MKILIIPDIHGRWFWKKPVEELVDSIDKIVFLGDYFDPYPYEVDMYRPVIRNGEKTYGGTVGEDDLMFENFDNIKKVQKDHPEKIILLLGNHDLHYISREFYQLAGGSRFSLKYRDRIKHAFDDGNFQVAYAPDTNHLFTHAGVNRDWLERHNIPGDSAKTISEILNKRPYNILSEVGRSRGGYCKTGGPLWSDVYDMVNNEIPGIFQVFGHTQQYSSPVIEDNFICCDVRRPFEFDTETNKLYELDGNEVRNKQENS